MHPIRARPIFERQSGITTTCNCLRFAVCRTESSSLIRYRKVRAAKYLSENWGSRCLRVASPVPFPQLWRISESFYGNVGIQVTVTKPQSTALPRKISWSMFKHDPWYFVSSISLAAIGTFASTTIAHIITNNHSAPVRPIWWSKYLVDRKAYSSFSRSNGNNPPCHQHSLLQRQLIDFSMGCQNKRASLRDRWITLCLAHGVIYSQRFLSIQLSSSLV